MALTAEQEKIASWIRGAVPKWFTSTPRAEEDIGALVLIFDAVRAQVAAWREQGAILTADGPVLSGGDIVEPDWLNQHAKDRNTHRQDGETDAALRERLRRYEDAVTVSALLSVVNAMLDAAGVTSNNYGLVELRRDKAYLTTRQRITGTGDALTKSGNEVVLTDAAANFAGGMLRWDRGEVAPTITIAGATSPANDGTFPVTGFIGPGNTAVSYVNASGVSEVFAGTWAINDALHDRQDAYVGRGYRCGNGRLPSGGQLPALVVIIPYNASEALRLAVAEAVRQRKAAGTYVIVERRANP